MRPRSETQLQRNALRGKWVILSGEANGEALPKEFLSAVSITFDDAFELKVSDFFECRSPFVLDGTASPKTIMLTGTGSSKATWKGDADKVQVTTSLLLQRYWLHSKFSGIYELEGNKLKLCIAQGGYSPLKRFDSRTDDGALFGALNLVLVQAPGGQAGWVQLFNGTDLAGWRPGSKQGFKVAEGVIMGTAPFDRTAVLTHGKEFDDFHCRIEAKVIRPGSAYVDFVVCRT